MVVLPCESLTARWRGDSQMARSSFFPKFKIGPPPEFASSSVKKSHFIAEFLGVRTLRLTSDVLNTPIYTISITCRVWRWIFFSFSFFFLWDKSLMTIVCVDQRAPFESRHLKVPGLAPSSPSPPLSLTLKLTYSPHEPARCDPREELGLTWSLVSSGSTSERDCCKIYFKKKEKKNRGPNIYLIRPGFSEWSYMWWDQ